MHELDIPTVLWQQNKVGKSEQHAEEVNVNEEKEEDDDDDEECEVKELEKEEKVEERKNRKITRCSCTLTHIK